MSNRFVTVDESFHFPEPVLDGLADRFPIRPAPTLDRDAFLSAAAPAGPLTFEPSAMTLDPKSVGIDGHLYGVHVGSTTRLFRSTEFGLAGHEYSTQTFEPKGVIWVSRTREGYAALLRDTATNNGEWWASESFASGWVKTHDFGPVAGLSVPRPRISLAGETIMLVKEYTGTASPSTPLTLWLTRDGGTTWSAVRQSRVVTSAINSHWHAADYDTATGRIWACNGDGPNSWFGWSDDWGASWVDSPTPPESPIADAGSVFQQPTVIHVMRDRLVLSPDRGDFHPGIWIARKDSGLTLPRFAVSESITAAHTQYGHGGYYAERGDEMFVQFSDTGSGTQTTYIAGTGDGGISWHLLATVPWGSGSLTTGVHGVDGGGYIYFKGTSLPTYGSGIAKAKAPAWMFN